MKFKIYYTVNDHEDYFIIEGDTIEDIKRLTAEACLIRNLHFQVNEMYSEQIKDESKT